VKLNQWRLSERRIAQLPHFTLTGAG